MAEEKTDAEIDLAKVQDFIAGQVQEHFKTAMADYNRQNPATHTQPQRTEQDIARDQLHSAISPLVKPDIDAVRLVSADTRDYVDFYTNSDIDEAEKSAVEKMFSDLRDAGRPLPRRDIYDYLQGKMARENPEEYETKTKARKAKQVDRAGDAVDFGFAALDRVKSHPTFAKEHFSKLSVEDMETALDGITF